jgi:REP element-mobilizing transposase RayT
VVVDALRFHNGKRYLLYDCTVMPDHVHAVLKPLAVDGKTERLSRIMHSIKSWLAHEINQRVGGSGRLWQDETYDHLLRNEADYQEKAAYIYDNPRRAGLTDDPAKWPWWGNGQQADDR